MRTSFLTAVVTATLAAAASAQTSAPQAGQAPARGATQAPVQGTTQAPARGATQAPTPPAPPPPAYTYRAGSRPDPFRNLLPPLRTADPTAVERTPQGPIEGPKDIRVSDITVKGVLQSGSTYLAMVLGPNGKTYVVRQGDSLRDGTIRSITPQGLVVIQNINDPLSTQSQREVRKLLRSFSEEAK